MPIKDSELINESYHKRPGTFWAWLFVFMLLMSALIGIRFWLQHEWKKEVESTPFTRVTNREMSIFLWHNPEFMRAHVGQKNGYLPAFQYISKVSVEPLLADEWVAAPPPVLFLYHTWKRQIGEIWIARSIVPQEFEEFLSYAEEWQPEFWKKAPASYVDLIKKLHSLSGNIAGELPLEVKLAFQGWKNYMKERSFIQALAVSGGELNRFLERYPSFRRPYWKNIVGENYLRHAWGEEEIVPQMEMAGFLKSSLYNNKKREEAGYDG